MPTAAVGRFARPGLGANAAESAVGSRIWRRWNRRRGNRRMSRREIGSVRVWRSGATGYFRERPERAWAEVWRARGAVAGLPQWYWSGSGERFWNDNG